MGGGGGVAGCLSPMGTQVLFLLLFLLHHQASYPETRTSIAHPSKTWKQFLLSNIGAMFRKAHTVSHSIPFHTGNAAHSISEQRQGR